MMLLLGGCQNSMTMLWPASWPASKNIRHDYDWVSTVSRLSIWMEGGREGDWLFDGWMNAHQSFVKAQRFIEEFVYPCSSSLSTLVSFFLEFLIFCFAGPLSLSLILLKTATANQTTQSTWRGGFIHGLSKDLKRFFIHPKINSIQARICLTCWFHEFCSFVSLL